MDKINPKKIITWTLGVTLIPIIFIVSILAYGEFSKPQNAPENAYQQMRAESKQRINRLATDFSNDKNKEINDLNSILKYGEPSSALALSYEFINALKDTKYKDDPDLIAFIDKAKIAVKKEDNINKTKKAFSKLKHHDQRAASQEVSAMIIREKSIADQKHKRKVKQQFAADGSNWIFVYYLKKQLHDPESFEHIETRYKDNQDHVYVEMRFRALNGFGAKRIFMKSAKVSIDNETVEFLD